MTKFTRKDLLNEECSHHEFYAQFVTERTLSFVRDRIGLVKLRKYQAQQRRRWLVGMGLLTR